eukprot:Polyplicarium_translucidae@DN1068_c0_g1_i1.p1
MFLAMLMFGAPGRGTDYTAVTWARFDGKDWTALNKSVVNSPLTAYAPSPVVNSQIVHLTSGTLEPFIATAASGTNVIVLVADPTLNNGNWIAKLGTIGESSFTTLPLELGRIGPVSLLTGPDETFTLSTSHGSLYRFSMDEMKTYEHRHGWPNLYLDKQYHRKYGSYLGLSMNAAGDRVSVIRMGVDVPPPSTTTTPPPTRPLTTEEPTSTTSTTSTTEEPTTTSTTTEQLTSTTTTTEELTTTTSTIEEPTTTTSTTEEPTTTSTTTEEHTTAARTTSLAVVITTLPSESTDSSSTTDFALSTSPPLAAPRPESDSFPVLEVALTSFGVVATVTGVGTYVYLRRKRRRHILDSRDAHRFDAEECLAVEPALLEENYGADTEGQADTWLSGCFSDGEEDVAVSGLAVGGADLGTRGVATPRGGWWAGARGIRRPTLGDGRKLTLGALRRLRSRSAAPAGTRAVDVSMANPTAAAAAAAAGAAAARLDSSDDEYMEGGPQPSEPPRNHRGSKTCVPQTGLVASVVAKLDRNSRPRLTVESNLQPSSERSFMDVAQDIEEQKAPPKRRRHAAQPLSITSRLRTMRSPSWDASESDLAPEMENDSPR